MRDGGLSPTFSGMLGGLLVSVIVALVSTWAAAEADRAEALRREQRAAFSEFLGAARTCATDSIFAALPDLRILSEPQLDGRLKEHQRRIRALRACAVPLEIGWADVKLLSDDRQLEEAAFELMSATTSLTGIDVSTEETSKYINALTRFEILADEEFDVPVLSPTLIQTGGLLIAATLLGAAALISSAKGSQATKTSAARGAIAED